MSNRTEWTFTILGSALVEPTRRCFDHHNERLAFWDKELDAATADLKANGVTINEPPEAAQFSTYRADAHIDIDQRKSRRVEECKRKVREHREAVAEYSRWLRAFEKNPDQGYPLDIDDMNYFRI